MKTDEIERIIKLHENEARLWADLLEVELDLSLVIEARAELAALETDNAAMREALNNLCLSADALQCKYDQEDSDVIAVRLDLDEADLALTLPTGKVLVDGRVAKLIKSGKQFVVQEISTSPRLRQTYSRLLNGSPRC